MARRKTRTKRRAGAKRAGKYLEKSKILNVRITPTTRGLLETAAKRSGRTVSSECEAQLQRALVQMGAGPTYAIMAAIGRSIDALARMRPVGGQAERWTKDERAHWLNDPYVFDQARQAVLAAFDMFRPRGELPQNPQVLRDTGGRRQGRFVVEATLREIQMAGTSLPGTKPTAKRIAYDRWLASLKADLGQLADRPVIWGRTADEIRKVRALSGELLEELIPLSRKAANTPQDITPEEKQRLAEIGQQLAEIREEEENRK